MTQNLRLINPNEDPDPKSSRGENQPDNKQTTHGAYTFVASGVLTAVEYRHGSHVILGPFIGVENIRDGLEILWSLPDGLFSGWMFWVGTLTTTTSMMLLSARTLAKRIVAHLRRQNDR